MDISTTGSAHIQLGLSAYTRQTTGGIPHQNNSSQAVVSPAAKDFSSNQAANPSDPTSSADDNNQPALINSANTAIGTQELTASEKQLVEQLKKVDAAVRQHEMAHIAAGGRLITSGASFSYQQGPDGKKYAVGGEVGIDTAPVPGDPQATIQKMKQVKQSALAPSNPSAQDLKVASKAVSIESKAQAELMVIQAKKQAETRVQMAVENPETAANAYVKTDNLPETDLSSFQIAV